MTSFPIYTLNENAGHLEGYPAEIRSMGSPHFLYVKPEGCSDILRVTPGHFVEEDEIVSRYGITPP